MEELKFPLFVSLRNKRITIFGGGNVALRRIGTLLLFDADVTVIAPSVNKEIIKQYEGKIKIIRDCYDDKYITKDVYMIIAATDDKAVNELIYKSCKENKILVNNASNKEQCDFYFPAVIIDEESVIGIAGNGRDHRGISRLAGNIREFINKGRA